MSKEHLRYKLLIYLHLDIKVYLIIIYAYTWSVLFLCHRTMFIAKQIFLDFRREILHIKIDDL